MAVYGSREGVLNKPDPSTANEIAAMMGLDNSEIMYVGDSDVDIRTGINAGIDHISVDWGFRTRDFLIENGAGIIFSDPASLADYLCS